MFKFLFASFFFVAVALAQNVDIRLPIANQSVTPGSDFIVQIQRENSLSSSEEVALVIGVLSCAINPCEPPSGGLGTILYNGPFTPQSHEDSLPPYQNFTVQIPTSVFLPSGTGSLGVAHVMLTGAGYMPTLQTLSQTITIA